MRHNVGSDLLTAGSIKRIVAVGEAMVELSPAGEDLYRLSFGGDTFNTIWHMSQLLGNQASTAFVTRVGSDALSNRFVAELTSDGLDAGVIGREVARHMGLYLIELTGTERSFQYWRNESAAKRLADQRDALEVSFDGADMLHVSGITLAVLSDDARENLYASIAKARDRGARVSFDPNVRPRLWSGPDEARRVVLRMLDLVDVALPSFDDEKALWGDDSPSRTLERYRASGVLEVVVKNGADPVVCGDATDEWVVSTPEVSDLRDTTGAGDAFNAGYLSARISGRSPLSAIRAGQAVSGQVLKHLGARAPKEVVRELGSRLFDHSADQMAVS